MLQLLHTFLKRILCKYITKNNFSELVFNEKKKEENLEKERNKNKYARSSNNTGTQLKFSRNIHL